MYSSGCSLFSCITTFLRTSTISPQFLQAEITFPLKYRIHSLEIISRNNKTGIRLVHAFFLCHEKTCPRLAKKAQEKKIPSLSLFFSNRPGNPDL
jgi:hypothetical protein